MSDPYCLPWVGQSSSGSHGTRDCSPNDTPPTPVRALQTPLGHKSDAHGNDNVVLRNAPSLQQLTETSSAASKARRHCCSTRTCRPPSLVLAETARPCDVRIHRAHSQRHWPSRLRPSQDSKPLACQPLCRRGHFNLRQIPSTRAPLRPAKSFTQLHTAPIMPSTSMVVAHA